MTSSKKCAASGRSLRERRREQTWNSLHESAVELVRQKGLKGTTTEEIAAAAGVSPRTFFNYFAAKEDAILGLKAPEITPEVLCADAQRNQRFMMERLVHLMLDLMVNSFPKATYDRYRKLAHEYPEFRSRIKVHINHCERVLQEFLQTVDWEAFALASRRGDFPYLPAGADISEETEKKTKAAVSVATAVLRYLDFSQGIPAGQERLDRVEEAVGLFQNLLRHDS